MHWQSASGSGWGADRGAPERGWHMGQARCEEGSNLGGHCALPLGWNKSKRLEILEQEGFIDSSFPSSECYINTRFGAKEMSNKETILTNPLQ